ncbi:MAG: diguanylate cyclase [Limnoraphis sp.]
MGISFGLKFIITDIRERQINEEKQQIREARFKEAQRVSRLGSWEFIPSTGQIIWSEEMFRLFGLYPQQNEPNYTEFLELIHPEDRSSLNHAVERTVKQGIPFKIDHRIIHSDASVRYLEARGDVIYSPQGEVIRMFGTGLDISEQQAALRERKQLELALKEGENRLRSILESSPYGIFIKDLQGKYTDVNPAYEQMSQLKREQLLGKSDYDILPDEFAKLCQASDEAAIVAKHPIVFEEEVPFQNGIRTLLITKFSLIDTTDQAYEICGIILDISDRKQAELLLQRQTQQEKAFNQVVQLIRNSLDLTTIFSIAVQQAAQLIDVKQVAIVQYQPENKYWIHLATYSRDANIPDTTGYKISDQNNPFAARLKQGKIVIVNDTNTIEDQINKTITQEFPGSWLLIPLIVNGRIWGSFSLLRNLSDSPYEDEQITLACRFADQLAIAIQQSQLYEKLQKANEQLHYLANHDQLTQIPNRRYFDEYLEQEWKRSVREQTQLILILCDLDYFKQYNDTYGHPTGDQCLLKVAQILNQVIQRPADFIARYGGEEFAIILPNTDVEGGIHVIKNIQNKLYTLNIPHTNSLVDNQVTLSFGLASTYPNLQSSVQALINRADQALYQTKQRGRNNYSIKTLKTEREH